MKNLVILAAMLAAFSVYGQSAVRRIDSLTNLLATIDPAAVGANGTVSYLVDGYYTAGDWGSSARELTASTTSGTTNFAHLLRSTKNSSFYWRSPDADSPVQDIRMWGAVAGDSVDDSAAVQAAVDYSAGTKTVFFPGGNWYFTNAITLPYDYQEFDGAGFNANIQVAHNGNGFQHFGVTNGEPRRYNIIFKNIRMTAAAGFAPEAAFRIDDVSYSYFDYVYVTQGSGVGFYNAIRSFGHYDLGTAIYGGNWGLQVANSILYNRTNGGFVIHGDGGPGSTGGPNDIKILNTYIGGGLSGSPSNGAAGAIFLQNCNMVRVENCDIEQYSTNSVWIGTNVQSASILNNRFEAQGGTTATRRLIHFDDYTTQGHVVMGNMMLIQGAPGSITRISGPGDSKRIPATILDPSFEGPNQVLASTFLIGTNLDGVARDFGPMGNKTIQMDRDLMTTNSIGVGVYDGTNNPRVFVILRDSEDGTGTNSRVDISAASSRASLPVYFVGSTTNAMITADGSAILGTNKLGNAFTVYGSGFFGNDPSNPYIEGWTTISNLIALRSSTTNKLALWLGTIDGGDNRRVELSVDPVDKSSTLLHTYTTGGGMMKHQVGTNVIFYLTDTLLTIVTNMTITTGAGLTVNGDYINDFTGANLSVSGGVLNVVDGPGSGLDAEYLGGQNGAYYLDRANHTGTQSYTTITGLGGLATINDAPSDGNTYGRNNGAWTIVTNSGGGGGSTNGTSLSVDGVYQTAVNITNSTKIDPTLSGTNLSFSVVPNSLQTNDIDSTFRAFITNQAGTIYTFSTGTTNSGGVITAALAPGGNITFTTNANTITIAAATGSTNSGTPLAVDGTLLAQANLADNTQINPAASGTNVTFSIVPNSLTTNEISSAFFNWIDGQGGGGGDVYSASNNVFTATNTFTGPVTGGVFSVTTIVLANPIGVTAVGTNVADAQDELQLTPGSYTMAYDLDLQQLATITWSNGVMAYHNGSTITNLVSTSTGRSLLTASSATNGRDVLEVGQLDQSAYGAGWDGVTNATPTLNALYDKIQSLPGGSNNISSWNTNYFSVTGGYLDWIGGSVSGGGGVTWIGNLGLSPLTNAATTTNVLLASFIVTTNKTVSTDGRFLEGGLDLMITNASSLTAAFNLRAKVNGTTVADLQRSMATATTPEFHTTRFRLIRESSTTAHLTLLGERWGGTIPTVGYGTFGSSGGEDLIVATNIAWNWGNSNTLDIDIGMSWSGTPTTNAIGVQRIAANLYNPGDGSAGSSSGTNLVFTVNGVTFDPVIITNSATVTWATNANGHIQATAAGGGSSDKTFVGGNPVTNANFVSSANGTVSISSLTNVTYTFTGVGSATNGYLYKSVDVFTNYNSSSYADVFNLLLPGNTLSENGDEIEIFTGGRFLNGSGSDSGYTWDFYVDGSTALSGSISQIADDPTDYLAVSFSIRIRRMSATNVFIMLENIADHYSTSLTTNEIGRLRFYANYPVGDLSGDVALQFSIANLAADPDVGMNLYGLTILKLGSAGGNLVGGNVYTSSNNVFTGSNTFNGSVLAGSTNLVTELANKQGLNANLTTVANLTSGTSTNFLAGDGTFKQVTTNMIPGLNAVVANVNLTSTPYDIAERYEQTFTPFTGNTTTTAGNPFTLAAINGGTTGTQSPVLGRSGLVKINSASTAYWSGGVAHSGANSIGLTNDYSWKVEFHTACTNGVTQILGFGDSTTTNAFTDGLFLAITNGTAYFSASEGGTVTTAGTSFAIPTNTFISAVCRGTNEIAVITLTTNGVAAWSEAINSANIPLGTSAVGVNVRAFVTSGAFTNAADLLILNYLGHEAATK